MAWVNRTDFTRNLAVVIGIDLYQSKNIHDLSTPVNDATALADLLIEEYGYEKKNVLCLFNKDANLSGLKTLLTDTLPNQLKPTEGDRLIFYFAGHGIPKDSDKGPRGYLVPQDAQPDQENSLLSMNEVYDALCQLHCHHLLVILDCCFAGTFRWASSRKLIAELEKIRREHYDRFIRHEAWQLITSSAHNQEALDSVKLANDQREQVDNTKHSPFAWALLEALRGGKADYTKDGVITAHELIVYLSDRVSELAHERQAPGLYPLRREYDKGEFIFVTPSFAPQQLLPAPELNPENNPYRGLKPFEERHADLFFGRQKLIEELGDRLAKSRCPLTAVLGTSGSGKSSLVKAGLLPYLRQKRAEDPTQHWCILTPIRPGKAPFAELAKMVLPVVNYDLVDRLVKMEFLDEKIAAILGSKSEQKLKAASPIPTAPDSPKQTSEELAQQWNQASSEAKLLLVVDYFNVLEEFFRNQPQEHKKLSRLHDDINDTLKPLAQTLQQQPESFNDAIAKWRQKHPNTKLLLVIDQFEELITMRQDRREEQEGNPKEQQEWQKFLSLLRIALVTYRQQLRVVVTLRSDFEPRFLDSALKKHWKSARFPVRAMNSDELRDAIEGPALKQALCFEPSELVGQLIDDVGQMPGSLPLLSFTLSELYIKLYERWTKDQSTDRALRIEDYKDLGGVAGALTRRATSEHGALDKEHQATLKRIMLRMVAFDGAGVARRRVLESELEYLSNEENERVRQLIDRFVNVRLLVKGQQDEAPYVEPAHDLLVRGWSLLQEWIDKEKENLVIQQPLAVDARDWEKQDKPEDNADFLWTEDSRIEQLEKIIAKPESSWLNKIETEFIMACARYRDRQARNRLEQQIELNTTDAQRFFASNDRLYAVDKLIRTGETLQERNEEGIEIDKYKELSFLIEFNRIISECREILSIDAGDSVNNFSCNSIAQVIATISDQYQRICFWDWQGRQINFEDNEERIYDLTFSPDGKTLITGGEGGLVKSYSRESNGWRIINRIQDSTKAHWGDVYCVNYNRDRNILVSGSQDGRIIVWTEKNIPELLMQQGYHINQVVFHPIDKLIAFTQFSSGNNTEYSDNSAKNNITIVEYQISDNGGHYTFQDCKYPQIKTGWDEGIAAIDFSPNGKFLVAGSLSGNIQIWPICKDKEPTMLTSGADVGADGRAKPISHVAFSPDGQIVATSHTNGIINLWDTSKITDAPSLDLLQKLQSLAGHKQSITRISFSSDSKYDQLLSSSDDGAVKVWFLRDRFEPYVGKEVRKISFSADQQTITTVDKAGKIKLWKTDGGLLETPFENQGEICDAQLSQDNEVVIAVCDGMVKLYSLDGTMLDNSIDQHNQVIDRLTVSPSGNLFVTVSRSNTVDVWKLNRDPLNIAWLKTLTEYHEQITAISFNDDGTVFASGSDDGTVILWNLGAHQAVTTIADVGGQIIHLILSDGGINGKLIGAVIYSETEGYKIKLYRYLNENVKELWCSVPTGRVTALRFYDENKVIVSIDEAGCIKIWSIKLTTDSCISVDNESPKEPEPQEPMVKHTLGKVVEAAAFDSTGEKIVMATRLNTRKNSYRKLHVLFLNLGHLLKEARERHPNYSRQETI